LCLSLSGCLFAGRRPARRTPLSHDRLAQWRQPVQLFFSFLAADSPSDLQIFGSSTFSRRPVQLDAWLSLIRT